MRPHNGIGGSGFRRAAPPGSSSEHSAGHAAWRLRSKPIRPTRAGLSQASWGQVYTRVAGGSPRSHAPATGSESRGEEVSSNIGQNYPYSSEPEEERARRVEATVAAHKGLRDKIQAEAVDLGPEDRSWVWKCPTKGCLGLLHAAGHAREAHAVYTVCDTCGRTYLR